MALTSVAALKTHLGVSSTTEDAFLGQLLPAVESAFAKFTDRVLEKTTYTEYYSGRGTPVILLREYPVISVTSVHLDTGGYYGSVTDSFGAETLLVSGTDYALVKDGRAGSAETGRLLRIGNVWPVRYDVRPGLLSYATKPCPGCIKVVYLAGYNPIPLDVQLAIWQVCAQLRAGREYGRPYSAEHYEEYSYSLEAQAASAWKVGEPAQIIARYRRITPRHEVLS